MGFCDILEGGAEMSGGRFLRLPQSRLLRHLDASAPSRKGICRALCMMHSALITQGTSIGAATGRSGDEQGRLMRDRYEQAMSGYAAKLQDDMQTIKGAVGSAADSGGQWKALYEAQAPLVGLKISAMVALTWPCTKEIGDFAIMSTGTNFIQIVLPNHVVMVYTKGDRFAIYDPNCGEVRTSADARNLLGFVMTHPVFCMQNGLTGGAEVYLAFLQPP